MLDRRDLLKFATAGGAAFLIPLEGSAPYAAPRLTAGTGALTDVAVPEDTFTSPSPARAFAAPDELGDLAKAAPFAHAMPVLGAMKPAASHSGRSPRSGRTVMTDVYSMRQHKARVEIVKGLKSTVFTYAGCFPGPMIKANRGHEVVLEHHNELDNPTCTHLHGGRVPSKYDGLPMDVVGKGGHYTYRYPNKQRAASLWYHDHSHGTEAENVYMGLYGVYLLSDEEERRLPLPKGQYDLPLVIRDARIEADGKLRFARPIDCPHMLVNGKERPYFKVAARKYRLRLYNVSINRNVKLRFADGAEFVQIATDCGLLEGPVVRDEIELVGAERAEIIVDFSRYRVGSSIVLENTAALKERPEIMRFDIVREAKDRSRIPDRLAEFPSLPKPSREREFIMTSDPTFLINGKSYDPKRVDVETTLGSHELWRIKNIDSPGHHKPGYFIHHSFHTHLAQFRVIHRNESPVGPGESGWKDTVSVPPGESVCIAVSWSGYAGQYVYHCHHLGHSSAGQMGRVDVKPR
ncbi:multicopper oxidase family protein [Streptomyces sp. NPDC059506]|uniref:multicopper oxidase family protein n=1 Tax=Streptomyces sp. NPDC059506 TaxID=3347751 RepID=UPI0036CC7437